MYSFLNFYSSVTIFSIVIISLDRLFIYKESPNAEFELGWQVQNFVRSQNYIGKHRRKAIDGAVRETGKF